VVVKKFTSLLVHQKYPQVNHHLGSGLGGYVRKEEKEERERKNRNKKSKSASEKHRKER
jgi:hypothetical protein